MGGVVLTLGFCLGLCLESTSWDIVTQGLEQGYLEVYINLGSPPFLKNGVDPRGSQGP